ncbi:ATP-dependent zinc protease [Candidatus Saccharibacteria bacterium]|nr:ATP-dependent zinc protease [Candidatus Saccharibacteria bacterium]
MNSDLTVIGSTEYLSIEGIDHVPAKIDTGADSSSIWVSDLDVSESGTLSFVLFDKNSVFYTGEKIERQNFSVLVVRSSTGHEEIRYRTELSFVLGGKPLKSQFTLSSREKNHFPILIGRKTLANHFLVDVSIRHVEKPTNPRTPTLNAELKADPYKFHQKHFNH